MDGFDAAILAAYQSKLVAWQNPQPTGTNSGHVAVVLPREPFQAGAVTASGKSGWHRKVPYIAQAGRESKVGCRSVKGSTPIKGL